MFAYEISIKRNTNKLKEGQVNISSLGEVAIIPKQFFYDLLKAYTEINKI